MRRSTFWLIVSVGCLCIGTPDPCRAQWTKDIECPRGTVYRDIREDAGRQEFCERLLPGSLKVKDGPFRSWFSEGHPGDEGTYRDGRGIGQWKECNRFDECRQVIHELTFPYERERNGFQRDVPVSFQHGKYLVDFTSCWSTWVTQSGGGEDLHLNIQGSPYRCDMAYLPEHVIKHGGEGDYYCRIPFSVGKREVASLDLLHELPKLGLPQFCRVIDRNGEAFMLEGKLGAVATTVDIQSAVIVHHHHEQEILQIRLNDYATALATEVAAKEGSLRTHICLEHEQKAEFSHDIDGLTQLNYRLSSDAEHEVQEQKCIADRIKPVVIRLSAR
jgi:hypothetical protein